MRSGAVVVVVRRGTQAVVAVVVVTRTVVVVVDVDVDVVPPEVDAVNTIPECGGSVACCTVVPSRST